MDVEVIIGISAVFASGTGLGIGATLLTQWAHRKLSWQVPTESRIPSPEALALKGEVEDLARPVVDLQERFRWTAGDSIWGPERRDVRTTDAPSKPRLQRP